MGKSKLAGVRACVCVCVKCTQGLVRAAPERALAGGRLRNKTSCGRRLWRSRHSAAHKRSTTTFLSPAREPVPSFISHADTLSPHIEPPLCAWVRAFVCAR